MAVHPVAILLPLTASLVLSSCLTAPEVRPSVPAASSVPAPITPVGTPEAPGAAPMLMRLYTHGGLCWYGEREYGECQTDTQIRRDGTYTTEHGPRERKTGVVSAARLDALAREIARADFVRLKSVPFKGGCPTAVDGSEDVYTFHVGSEKQEIASCKVTIDDQDPLFVAADAVIKEVLAATP